MYGQQMYGQPVTMQQGRFSPMMGGGRGPGGLARGQPNPHYMGQVNAGGMGQQVPRGATYGGMEIGPDGMPMG